VLFRSDVKPGDALSAGFPRLIPNAQGASTTMTAAFTATTGYNHRFDTECGSASSAGPNVTLTFYDGCRTAKVDVIGVQTSTAVPPAPSRYVLVNQDYVAGPTFTIPNNWVDMATFGLTLTGVPDDITSISMDRATQLKAGPSARVASQSLVISDAPAGTVVGTLRYPAGVGNRAVVGAQLNKTGFSSQRLEVQTADVTGAQTIDATELPLPWISGVTITPAERKITWTETGAGTPDVRLTAATFRYTRDNVVYNVTVYDFAASSATPQVVLPLLPTAYAEFDPGQQTVPITSALGIVSYIDQSNLSGYEQGRGVGVSIISALGTYDVFAGQAFHRRSTVAISGRGLSAGVAAAEAALPAGFAP
jgi:hypothetical protein